MANYVECKICKARCSRDVDGEIEVTALVKCSECFINEAKVSRDIHIAFAEERRRKIWGWIRFGLASVTMGFLIYIGMRAIGR